MSYKITFIEDTKIVKTIFYGDVQPDEVEKAMIENLKVAKKYQTSLFLADCTAIEDQCAFILENYEIGILLSEMAEELPHQLKDAVILPRSPNAAGNLRFFETVSRNRGMSVRTFDEEADALAWLLDAW